MRHLNETVIAAYALLFSAAHAHATSVPVIRVECHETRVDTVTTNNVVSSNNKTNNVVVYEIKEDYGLMYEVMYNGTPVYNGMAIYIKSSPQAIVLDDHAENPPPPPNAPPDIKNEKKMMLNRITGDLSFIVSTFAGGNGMTTTITGHCEPVTLTPKF
jgi:hypothetical protein